MDQDKKLSQNPDTFPPVSMDIAYSLVMLGTTIVWTVVDSLLLYFYLPPEGKGVPLVPVASYGVVVLIASIVNALVTPPIGYWSDHLRSKWGRRLPLMFGASLPLVISFVLLWLPPVQKESMINLLYLGLILIVFNVTLNLVGIPLVSLLPEITTTDRHRVRLTAWSSSFQLIGMVIAALAALLVDEIGYVNVALIYAVVVLPFLYLPFYVLREEPGRQIKTEQRLGLIKSIRTTINNHAFFLLSIAGIGLFTATTFLIMSIPFIVTEICQQELEAATYFYLMGIFPMLACFPLVNWLSGRYGKWIVFSGSLFASALVFPGLMLIGPWLPIPLFYQGLIWIGLQAVAMSGVTMLPQAFAAEITDYDETLTGQRREGAYYSSWSLLEQIISGVAALLLPLLFLLGRSQTDPNGPLGVRLVGLIGGLLMFVSFLLFFKYPLQHLSRPPGSAK